MELVRKFFDDCRVYMYLHPKLTIFSLAVFAAYELGLVKFFWGRIFVRLEVRFAKNFSAKFKSVKTELFSSLHELNKGMGPLKIVEIGPGGGSNFDFYPEGSEVIGVDPNPLYKPLLNREVDAVGRRVVMTKTVQSRAEDMDSFVAENSADAVVATLVLCSVDDVAAVVSQVHRVLKPGGVFLFLHHNRADEVKNPWLVRLQGALTPILSPALDGCHFDRDPIIQICAAGFSHVRYEKRSLGSQSNFSPFSLVRLTLLGCATK